MRKETMAFQQIAWENYKASQETAARVLQQENQSLIEQNNQRAKVEAESNDKIAKA